MSENSIMRLVSMICANSAIQFQENLEDAQGNPECSRGIPDVPRASQRSSPWDCKGSPKQAKGNHSQPKEHLKHLKDIEGKPNGEYVSTNSKSNTQVNVISSNIL